MAPPVPDTARRIDLRSDTVTQPTPEMRKAMAEAEVGDDVYGEDPTVRRLEAEAAKRLGTEAALFMPTGTMVNQAAIWVHTGRGGAVVCEEGAHILNYEGGAPALLSGALVRPVRGQRGVFTAADLDAMLPPSNIHFAPWRLLSIENTHNRAGGTVWTAKQTKAVVDWGHDHGIPTHIDGARIFNAAIAREVTVASLTQGADSVGFCLSKGLSAPVGSLLCGRAAFLEKARAVRKVLGGAMRQSGILAAAGLVALSTMVDRLKEDHKNARRLAAGIAKVPGIRVDLDAVQTNIVVFDPSALGHGSARDFCDGLKPAGVLASPRDIGPEVRMVTHRHVSRADVDAAIAAVEGLARPRPRASAPRRR